MKNFYELSSEERREYRKEFNNLKFVKDINIVIYPTFVIALLSLIADSIFSGLIEEGMKLQAWADFNLELLIFATGIFGILSFCLGLSFIRWMKIKHNVEY